MAGIVVADGKLGRRARSARKAPAESRPGFRAEAFSWLVPEASARAGPAVRLSEEGLRLNRAAARLLCRGEVPRRAWMAVGTAPRAVAIGLAPEGQGYPAHENRGGLRVHSSALARELEREGWALPRTYRLVFDRKSLLLVALAIRER